jgi:transposase
LEDAGIKIDSVASRLLGTSGRAMIEALIAGERNPGRLADLAKGLLRRKTDELLLACDGRFTAAHAQMCTPVQARAFGLLGSPVPVRLT